MVGKFIQISFMSILIGLISSSFAGANIEGVWLTGSGESRVKVSACGDRLCGVITWLRDDAAKGKVTKDKKNKDKSLRKRPMVGIQALNSVRPSGNNAWKGRAYNPGDGNTYSAKLKLMDKNTLNVSGCILGGLVCKKQTWYRLDTKNGPITGNWYVANGKSKIKAYNCGSNICAKIDWIERGQPASFIGKELLIGMAKSGKGWKGKALNPENDKTYSSQITQVSGDMVKLRACLGGVACQNLFWHRGM